MFFLSILNWSSLGSTHLSLKSIETAIGGKAYQHSRVNQWTTSVVEQCLSQLSKMGKPFKYIGMSLDCFLICVVLCSWYLKVCACVFYFQKQPVSSCRKMEQACRQPAHAFGTTPLMVRWWLKWLCSEQCFSCRCVSVRIYVYMWMWYSHWISVHYSSQAAVLWDGRTSPCSVSSVFLAWPSKQTTVVWKCLFSWMNQHVLHGHSVCTYFVLNAVDWTGDVYIIAFIYMWHDKVLHT